MFLLGLIMRLAQVLNLRGVFVCSFFFFFSSRRRHTRFDCDWSSDVCSSDLEVGNMLTNILMVAAGVGVSVVPASMRGIQSSLVSYLPLRGAAKLVAPLTVVRSEERRVGKECRSRGSPYH